MFRLVSAIFVLLAATPAVARRELGPTDVVRRMKMNAYTVNKDLHALAKGLVASPSPRRHEAMKTFHLMVQTLGMGEQLLAMKRPNAYIFNGYRSSISSSLVRLGDRYALGYGQPTNDRPWVLLVLRHAGVSRIQFGANNVYDGVDPIGFLEKKTDEPLETFFAEQIDFADEFERKANTDLFRR